MRIACAFDHAGVPLRRAVLGALDDSGDHVLDLGDADDYPQSASAVAAAILVGPELARKPVRIFVAARFSGAGRDERRLAEVAEIEKDNVAHTRATAKEIEA